VYYVSNYTAREALQGLVEDFLFVSKPLVYVKKETTQVEVKARNAKRGQMTEDIARFVNVLRSEDYGDILENVPAIYNTEVWTAYHKLVESGGLEPNVTSGRRTEVTTDFIESLVISQQAEDAASELRRRKYLAGQLELGELTDVDREWFRQSAEDNRSQAEAFAQAAEAARVAAERAQAAAESQTEADSTVWNNVEGIDTE
jgi:hypothetical protein